METKIAILSIIIKDRENVEKLNKMLTDYGDYIIGRMGLPYEKKKINIISIVMDATQSTIDNLSNEIKKIDEITVETMRKDI